MDFRTLETFVWVATLGSFRGAAQKLNTTQPAISQRIAQLEAECGVRLIDRQTRSVLPTAKGRELLVYADRLLRIWAEMREAIAGAHGFSGILRIGVSETIVHTWLPRLIETVGRVYPRLSLEIEVDISPNLRSRLLAHELDLALLLGPISAPEIENRPLCRFPIDFLASPKLGLPDRLLTAEDLARHPILTFARGTQPYHAMRENFRRHALPGLRLHASAALSPVIRMASDGLGIAAVPAAIARAEIAAGTLRVLKTALAIPDLAFTASWVASLDGLAAASVGAIAVEIAGEAGAGGGDRDPTPSSGSSSADPTLTFGSQSVAQS